MAVQRLSLTEIETAICQIFGYANSTTSHWSTSANLYKRINTYLQRLPMRLSQFAAQVRDALPGKSPLGGIPRLDMWRSSGNVSMSAAGNQIGYLPADYDQYINFWITGNRAPVYITENVHKYHPELYNANNTANPTHIEILGFANNSGTWQRKISVWPNVEANATPTVSMEYWRIPAKMPGNDANNEYPDIDPKYEYLCICGPATELARPSAPEFDRYAAEEKAILTELLMTANGT